MQETSHKNAKTHQLSEKLTPIIFINFNPIKSITKQSKIHQEQHGNFFGIFVKNFRMNRGFK